MKRKGENIYQCFTNGSPRLDEKLHQVSVTLAGSKMKSGPSELGLAVDKSVLVQQKLAYLRMVEGRRGNSVPPCCHSQLTGAGPIVRHCQTHPPCEEDRGGGRITWHCTPAGCSQCQCGPLKKQLAGAPSQGCSVYLLTAVSVPGLHWLESL